MNKKLGYLLGTVGVIAATTAGLLVGLAPAPTNATTPVVKHSAKPAAVTSVKQPDPTRFAALGDSMTSWTFDGVDKSTAWAHVADGYPLAFQGGYALSGAKSFEILAAEQNQAPMRDVDALVILAGRNDVDLIAVAPWKWDIYKTAATVEQMVAISGVKHILISAIAPCGLGCENVNWILKITAQKHGWGWVDPWPTLTDPATGHLYPQDTIDGEHPTDAGYGTVGLNIRAALLAMCANDVCRS